MTTLCCPKCGNTELYSDEAASIMYPVLLARDDAGTVTPNYDVTFGEREVIDEDTKYRAQIWCHGCAMAVEEAKLISVRQYAHLDNDGLVIVTEDSDRGVDVRWQAVCWAASGDFKCGWCGPWRHADSFVEEAAHQSDSVPTDPGNLAYEAAEADGRQHLKDEGVEQCDS